LFEPETNTHCLVPVLVCSWNGLECDLYKQN